QDVHKDRLLRAYYGVKGVTQVAQSIAGMVCLSFDFEDFEEGLTNIAASYQGNLTLVDGKMSDLKTILGRQRLRIAPWYNTTQTLLCTALRYLCLQDRATFEKQQKQEEALRRRYSSHGAYCTAGYAAYAQARDKALDAITDTHQRSPLQYGIASQMGLLALKSTDKTVQQQCLAWLRERLEDRMWYQEPAVVKTILTALAAAHKRQRTAQDVEDTVDAVCQRRGATWPVKASWCWWCAVGSPSLQACYDAWTDEQYAWEQETKQTRASAAVPLQEDRLHAKVRDYLGARVQSPLQLQARQKAQQQRAQRLAAWQSAHIPQRTQFFVGRADTLAALQKAFDAKAQSRTLQVLCGPSGMGKRQVAIQLARTYLQASPSRYDHIFWLQAETAQELHKGYLAIAQILGIHVAGLPDVNAKIKLVKDHLQAKHCLYIFENAPSSEHLRPFLPTSGSVLITSYNGNPAAWSGLSAPIPLGAFDKRTVIALAKKHGYTLELEKDAATLQYLDKELSGYPLTLNQFFSACTCCETAPAEFIETLKAAALNEQDDLLLKEVLEKAPAYGKSMLKVLKKKLDALA
ncbi:MAG: hypothetical protein AAFQ78_02615, partial [Bacteroidota bacterium]